MGESHAYFMPSEFDGLVIPSFEFITAPTEPRLSDLMGRRHLETIGAIAELVEAGKRQGTTREDMDSRMAAYELMICAWAGDIAQLICIDEALDLAQRSRRSRTEEGCAPCQGAKSP
jgi:hypothetical protein